MLKDLYLMLSSYLSIFVSTSMPLYLYLSFCFYLFPPSLFSPLLSLSISLFFLSSSISLISYLHSNYLPHLCQPPLLHPSTSSQPSPCPIWQDIVGGRFDATQAFVGEMSQFNMWDRVLRPADIIGMANCSAYMPGNVIPWVDTNVEVMGGATKAPLEICEDRAFDS